MNITRAHRDILEALEEWTPIHWVARKVRRQYHPNVTDDIRLLLKHGWVEHNDPNMATSKHYSYRRTVKADQLLGVESNRSTAGFEHQVLDRMHTLSIEFGVDEDKAFRLKTFKDMLQAGIVENPELLKRIRSGGNPHKLFLNGHSHFYDNNNKGPLWLQHEKAQTFIFKEIDRDTEQGRNTALTDKPSNRRQTWTNKIRAMKEFGQKKEWKTWYGCTAHFQAIVTVNEQAKELIKAIIKEEIGACAYIGVKDWRDWGNHKLEQKGGERKYAPADGWGFTVGYERVGYAPRYLNKFWED